MFPNRLDNASAANFHRIVGSWKFYHSVPCFICDEVTLGESIHLPFFAYFLLKQRLWLSIEPMISAVQISSKSQSTSCPHSPQCQVTAMFYYAQLSP